MAARKSASNADYAHETLGFGVPATTAPHHFVVRIPKGNRSAVCIDEDLGLDGKSEDEAVIPRAEIHRSHWSAIKGPVKRAFNARLKAHGLRPGQFRVGENKVDRLLGKELCLLAWGIQGTSVEQAGIAVRNWLAMKPEERWWIFGMTAASAGEPHNPGEGWRMAVRYLLTDRLVGAQSINARVGRAASPTTSLGLFSADNTTNTEDI